MSTNASAKPKPVTKPAPKPGGRPKPKTTEAVVELTVDAYRRKFFIKFARLVKGGKPFTADNFRSIGVVSPQHIGGMWRSALTLHAGSVSVVGSRMSTAPSRKGARLPLYQGI